VSDEQSPEDWAAENEQVLADTLTEVRKFLAARPRTVVITALTAALERQVPLGKLASAHAVTMVQLIEEEDNHDRTLDAYNVERSRAERYRLAWLHARDRARNLRLHAEYVETERDGRQQALNDWIADSGDERVCLARQVRDQALLTSYSLRDQLDDTQHELETLRALHKDLDERYLMALDDCNRLAADGRRLAAELAGVRTTTDHAIKSFAQPSRGGEMS
jgi:hypothetical protein